MSRTHNVFTLDAFTHKFPKQNFVTLNPVTHNILSHTQLSPTRLSHPHNCHTHAHTRNSVTFNSHARFVTRLSPSYNVMPYATPVFAKGELVILRSKNALVLDISFFWVRQPLQRFSFKPQQSAKARFCMPRLSPSPAAKPCMPVFFHRSSWPFSHLHRLNLIYLAPPLTTCP